MKDGIGLRITKTQYEKLLQYAIMGSAIEYADKEMNQRDSELVLLLLLIAENEGLSKLVARNNDEITPTETLIKKIEKIMNAYERSSFEKIAEEVNKKIKYKK